MEFKYIWMHEPVLSSVPTECLKYNFYEKDNTVCEMAVFKLENDKFCFIKFLTEDKTNVECGLTDIEETDLEEDAVKIFQDMNWEI